MQDNRCSNDNRGAVCIDTKRVLDSCRDNIEDIVPLVDSLYNYVTTTKIFAFNYELAFNETELNGTLTVDTNNFNLKVSANINGKNENFILIDSNLYVEYDNILAKYDINNLPEIDTVLSKFGISIPLTNIVNIFNSIKENGMSAVIALLANIEFDLTSLDLSVLENIIVSENSISISLENIGNILVATTEDSLDYIYFNSEDINIKLTATSNTDIAITHEESNYIDLAKLIPMFDKVYSYVKNNKVFGFKYQVAFGENVLNGNLNIDIESFNLKATLDINGNNVNLTLGRFGRGTASEEMLDYLGIGDKEKCVLFSFFLR